MCPNCIQYLLGAKFENISGHCRNKNCPDQFSTCHILIACVYTIDVLTHDIISQTSWFVVECFLVPLCLFPLRGRELQGLFCMLRAHVKELIELDQMLFTEL